MFTRTALLLLIACVTASKVDWWGLCSTPSETYEAGDISAICSGLDRGKTFSCLAADFRKGADSVLTGTCADAVKLRGEQERQNEQAAKVAASEEWKQSCADEIKTLCADIAADLSAEQFSCIAKQQKEASQTCLTAMVKRQSMQQKQQERARSETQTAPAQRPPPPSTLPKPRVPPGLSARLRSAYEPDLCATFVLGEQVGSLQKCNQTDPDQAWYIVPTASGYTMATGSKECLAPDATLVPCASEAKTFFALNRRDDHTVVIQDLYMENCFYDSPDGFSLAGDCESEESGWFIEPLFTKFVVAPELTEAPTATPVFVVPETKPVGKKDGKAAGKAAGKKGGKTGKKGGKKGKKGN